jgi:hypothetical protein
MPEIFGKNLSKQDMWIGGGAVAVFGIGYYRYRKQQKADQAAADAATAPGTGAGSSDQIDPATGFPYGSAEDAAALTAQAGYNSPVNGLNGGGGYYYGGQPYGPGGGQPPGGFTSNAEWSQAAESFLVDQEGQNANAVGNALGKYITGQVVTDPTAQGYINQAIAFEGYPPVAGPNGFPPNIRTGPVPPGPGPHPDNTKVVVPHVVGLDAAQAFNVLRSEALQPEPGGLRKTDIVISQTPAAGTSVNKHTKVTVKVEHKLIKR